MDYDVIIIGAGISGVAASIYLKKANKRVLIIEKNYPGGAIATTSSVLNYPGIITTTGPDFANALLEQIKFNDIEIVYSTVLDIKSRGKKKTVRLKNRDITARYIIIATGKEPKKINVPGEDEYFGRGVSYCALCDAALYKNKNVAVIGAGLSALEETIYLSNICNSITIINKYSYFKCQEECVMELNKKENVQVEYGAKTISINGDDRRIKSITYLKNDEMITKEFDGVFIYAGSSPNIFTNLNLNLVNNYIKVNKKMETNIKGIYAVGDVIKKDLYQLVTAASEGAVAATSIIKEINKK